MNDLSSFHFIRPWCLLFLPAVIGVWWMVRTLGNPFRRWQDVMAPELLDAATVNRDQRQKWRTYSLLTGWVIAAIAVAGPAWRPEPSPFADDPVPVMLLLKSGETMNQTDLSPSRMERARLKVADFAELRKGLPLGLIAYAGSAHLVLPPTRDTGVVATMAAEIGPEIMPTPGDELAVALTLAVKTLGDRGGSIVVVADTVPAGTESALKEFRASYGVSVEILGVAREETPERDDLANAASNLRADLTLLTPDTTDVATIVRRIADTPIAVSVDGAGTRWAEMGWWLVPIVALWVLSGFRRDEQVSERSE